MLVKGATGWNNSFTPVPKWGKFVDANLTYIILQFQYTHSMI